MERTMIKDAFEAKGKVLLKGWVHDTRDLKKVRFLVLKDMSGRVQVTGVNGITRVVEDGVNVTLSGTSFGPNGPTIWVYDNFTRGTHNQQVSLNDPPVGAWTATQGATYIQEADGNIPDRRIGATLEAPCVKLTCQ